MIARSLAQQSQARTPTDSEQRTILIIGPDCNWFELSGERVEMGRRGAPRRILEGFVTRDVALGVEALFEIGWPDQSISIDAANKRVYSAIRTLRRLGLENVIVTTDDGYRLHPELLIDRR